MIGFHPHQYKNEIVFLGTLPKIELTKEAYQTMVYLTELSDKNELSWMGSVEKKENNVYLIKEVFLFKQKVISWKFKIDPDDFAAFVTKALQKPGGVEFVNSLLFLGHVEPGTAVSFGSQHDADVMEAYSKSKCDFFIQAIAVRSGEIQFTVYDYVRQVIFRDVAWEVLEPENAALKVRLQAEVKRKIKEEKPKKVKVASVPPEAFQGCPLWPYLNSPDGGMDYGD